MAPKQAAKAAAKPEAKAKAKAAAKEKVKEEPRPEDLIPKVAMPNKEEYDEKLAAVQADIDKIQKQQQDLAKRISERSGGKDEYQAKRVELRAELDHWSGLIDGCKSQKDEISKTLGDAKAEGQQQRSELNKMKKSIGFTSETEIDQEIARIEFKMHHSSVSLKEEKQLMDQIKQLKKDRPKVAGIHKLESSIGSDDKGLSLKESRKSISEQMGMYFEEKKKVSEKLKELNEQRKAETGDLPALIEEREGLSGKVREMSAKRQQIRAEHRAAEQEYYAYQAEIRKMRQERSAQERQARQADYDKEKRVREAAKLDDPPHTSEITLIEQTIAFCKTFSKESGAAAVEEKKEIVHGNLDGMEVMVSKKDRDEDMYFVPSKGKKSKGKAKAAAAEGSEGKGKPIKHSAETFQLFNQLKLDAPITTADIPGLLEKLEEKLADYQGKVKEWQLKKDELKKKILEGTPDDEEKAEEKEEEKAEE
jgi:uncharacterized coiled-coil DUF342 family protein